MTWWSGPSVTGWLASLTTDVNRLGERLKAVEERLDAAISTLDRHGVRQNRLESKAKNHASGLLQLQATIMAQGSTLDAISDRVDALAKLDARADLAKTIEEAEARND
jgi:chromosome segregation ATPase